MGKGKIKNWPTSLRTRVFLFSNVNATLWVTIIVSRMFRGGKKKKRTKHRMYQCNLYDWFDWMWLNVRRKCANTPVWDALANDEMQPWIQSNPSFSIWFLSFALGSVQCYYVMIAAVSFVHRTIHFTIELLPLFHRHRSKIKLTLRPEQYEERKKAHTEKKSTSLKFYLDIYYNEANVLHILILAEFYWFFRSLDSVCFWFKSFSTLQHFSGPPLRAK